MNYDDITLNNKDAVKNKKKKDVYMNIKNVCCNKPNLKLIYVDHKEKYQK